VAADPTDPSVHVTIFQSVSSRGVDGYAEGEPKYLNCPQCDGSIRLTPEPSPGWDAIHDADCPYAD